MELQNILAELGFSKGEAKIYIALLKNGISSVNDIKDIVNNEEAGENLLKKVNEKTKQQQANTTPPVKKEDKKLESSTESKEEKQKLNMHLSSSLLNANKLMVGPGRFEHPTDRL